MDGIEVNNVDNMDGLSEWREKHRLGKIVKEISVGKRTSFWLSVFYVIIISFGLIFSAATFGADSSINAIPFTFAKKEEFAYTKEDLIYSSCSLGSYVGKDNEFVISDLADLAFLSEIAYRDDDEATRAIEEWFGEDVENYFNRVQSFKEISNSSVSYKLFNFPSKNNLKVVSIQGTTNSWDTLANAQLWSLSALVKFARDLLPLASVLFNPVLHNLVNVVSFIEEGSLEDVSYYKETTKFVKELKDEGNRVQIVGHCKSFEFKIVHLCLCLA